MNKYALFLSFLYLCSCSAPIPDQIQAEFANLPKNLDYNIDVKPILSDKCFACHGPDKAKQKAGLRLDIKEVAFGELPKSPGKYAIDPGDLTNSEVFRRIISTDPKQMMPTPESHLALNNYEKAVLIKWIQEGAEYKPHWAFEKPIKPDIPEVGNEIWAKNSIDNFVLEKLEQKKLTPNSIADKATLLRRVTFDLTGLPPTLPEFMAFYADKSENAYEKVVDRLMKSPQYGERLVADWLDVARYADTHGYTVDRVRDTSPYRDWVVSAFNQNLPYDKFIHWQLAGDLMPKPTKDMVIATAFNRNHQQNMEGGIVDEEFQTEYVIDRTNTFGDAFLGISVGCAKCHDHKYDPISQKNYYELFSFFNNVKEAGQISWGNSMPSPTLLLPTAKQEQIVKYIQTKINTEQNNLASIKSVEISDFNNWIKTGGYTTLAKEEIPRANLQAKFGFKNGNLNCEVNPKNKAYVTLNSGKQKEEIVKGRTDEAIKLSGDPWIVCENNGVFRRSTPFSIGISVFVPNEFKEGVIFHTTFSERLFAYKGYHLRVLKDGTLDASITHAAPSNAITKFSKIKMPKNQWVYFTMTYDGSSKAQGLNLYLNGQKMEMTTEMDQLTKDILISKSEWVTPQALQVGGWDRGLGLKNGIIDDISVYNRELTPFESAILSGQKSWKLIASKPANQLNKAELEILGAYYFSAIHKPALAQFAKLQASRTALADSVENVQELMVMQESPKPRQTHILIRGAYDTFGEKVYPNTPTNILKFPSNLPKNRYGLAQWLTNPDHPLTARVVVNRLWQNLFGIGLVKTAEDFGNQGELPSHPKLLDYLAVTFVESGWNIKLFMKNMVMSATYQQDSKTSKDKLNKDFENRFLARGPSNRLTAEMIRDNALAAAGLLKKTIGGKAIKPYQPLGIWEINSAVYTPDSTDEVYKRSLYILVKRSVNNATLATFDATTRSYCTVRRQKTNTPLQALVTLNDPTFVEASKVLGQQIVNSQDTRKAITEVYFKLTGKFPTQNELKLLLALQDKEYQKFKENPKKTYGWLNVGYFQINKSLDQAFVAANAVVANVIMNSDATLTKR